MTTNTKPEVRKPGACVSMPWAECGPGLFEINEFDCASCFLVVGSEKALLLDTGVGIGDLRGMVENHLNGMPYEVVATHNHGDHIGGAGWFDDLWIHPADGAWQQGDAFPSLNFRMEYAELIRNREGKKYPYDPEKDIRPWPKMPEFHPLRDGQVFDLGGRKVTVYHCPGHTPGEVVLTDDLTEALLCGDACNCNWLLSRDLAPTVPECVERALLSLRRILQMSGTAYDPARVYNFHHDFRPFGKPLSPEVLPTLESCLAAMLNGTCDWETVPDPLSMDGGRKTVARKGLVMVSCMGADIRQEMTNG